MKHAAFALLMSASAFAVFPIGVAQAGFTVEGEIDSITVIANDAERSEVIAAIVERFGLETEGGVIEAGPVSGRYSGNLSAVLKSILSANGYAIAYRDGRPTRVSFPSHRSQKPLAAKQDPVTTAKDAIKKPSERPETTKPEPPTLESMLSRQASQQLLAGESAPANPENAFDGDMAKQVADMTRQAVEELKALKRSIDLSAQ